MDSVEVGRVGVVGRVDLRAPAGIGRVQPQPAAALDVDQGGAGGEAVLGRFVQTVVVEQGWRDVHLHVGCGQVVAGLEERAGLADV